MMTATETIWWWRRTSNGMIERRRGKRIAAKDIYRDPVRSSHGHFVKAIGLRWLSLMLLVPIPWARRVWALPFLTALASSKRYCQERGRRHKKLTGWGRQLVLRLDAALYDPAPPRRPGTKGRRLATLSEVLTDPATPWQRVTVPVWYGGSKRDIEVSTDTAVWRHGGMPIVLIRWVLVRDPMDRFEPQALLWTDLAQDHVQILRWSVQHWQVEVTFREVRNHLGVETQRQWTDRAIARTPPCLLGLFSLMILLGKQLTLYARRATASSAWYLKPHPTFADTLAAVRRDIWQEGGFGIFSCTAHMTKLRPATRNAITYALCHAA